MILLLWSMSCQPAPAARPGPPPAAPVLTAYGMVHGEIARASVSHPGLVGRRVDLVLSEDGLGAGPCPPALAGACFQVLAPMRVASAVADASGVAWLSFPTPLRWSELEEVHLQAVVTGAGQVWVSPPVSTRIVWAANDDDRDGIRNQLEAQLGLDPLRVDTDGGGTSDGQEVWADMTDPLLRGDDSGVESLCTLGFDDDRDGRRDCDDPDCRDTPWCEERDCGDGVDNNHDRLVDCADSSCAGRADCVERACGDGVDNDGDSKADCEDNDCAGPGCVSDLVVWGVPQQVAVEEALEQPDPALPPVWVGEAIPSRYKLRMWVNDTNGPRICDTTTRLGMSVADPACGMNGQVGPLFFEWDPLTQVLQADGRPFLLPVAGVGPDLDPSSQRNRYVFEATPAVWSASCNPSRMWLDRDGDGFGVSDAIDTWGMVGGLFFACAPGIPSALAGGDCDDQDPSINPQTVRLAAGRACPDTAPDDRDADGSPAGVDADDRDGGIP